MRDSLRLLLTGLLATAIASPSAAATNRAYAAHWVSSWYASPQPIWGPAFILPTNLPTSIEGQTIREIVQVSTGGKRVRLHFSNRYGTVPLHIGEVRLALSAGGPRVIPASTTLVTFNGKRSVHVPAGAPVLSDPIAFPLASQAKVAVTSYYPSTTALTTFHWGDQQTAFVASGNRTASTRLRPESVIKGRVFLTGLLVEAAARNRTVVAFGDSIADGNGSTPDAHRRWPDFLARRFAASHVAVANAGISGGRVLSDHMGESALARFDRDVLGQPGVRSVVISIGINDIGWPGSPFAPNDPAMSAQRLIAGYQQLIDRARARRVRTIGATLLPFEGALQGTPFEGHFNADKERVRQEVNRWIRTSGAFDAVVDFDAVLRDPAHPARLLPAYDSGDHLHPGDAGYRAMADAFDLTLLFGAP